MLRLIKSVIKVTHRGDVLGGKLVGGVGDEQAGLSHRTITHHHTLYSLHLRRRKVGDEGQKRDREEE